MEQQPGTPRAGATAYAHLDLAPDERRALEMAAEFSDRVGRERVAARGLTEYLSSRGARAGQEEIELPDLVVQVERPHPTTVVCRPDRELDAANTPQLEQALVEASAGCALLLLDLAAVPLVDSAALSGLLRARRRLSAQDAALRVVGLQPAVARVLRVTGLTAVLGAPADPRPDPRPDPQSDPQSGE